MKRIKTTRVKGTARQFLCGMLVVGILLVLGGCPSAMTTSQVNEVNKFAQAAEAYGPLPGDVLRFYADLKWQLDLFNISTQTPDAAQAKFSEKTTDKKTRYSQAARADKALSVLGAYASLLKTLTASDYGEAVDREAKRFGEEIDTGLAQYNEMSGTDVSSFGSLIASGVSAVGRLYVKDRQGQVLQEAVTEAQPGVDAMLSAVRVLLKPYQGKTNDFTRLGKSLESSFKPHSATWYKAGQPIPIDILSWYDSQYLSISQGERLAKQAYDAAQKYKEAHLKLVKAVSSKEKLPEIIGCVESFASEVKAALALKREMDK